VRAWSPLPAAKSEASGICFRSANNAIPIHHTLDYQLRRSPRPLNKQYSPVSTPTVHASTLSNCAGTSAHT
jgi:hypothetical protein